MAKKRFATPPTGPTVRKAAVLNEILRDLESEDENARAEAVRELCPCRSAWGVPVQRYVAGMRDDPSSTVRHEVHHVLDEDSKWGQRLNERRARETIACGPDESDVPGPHSLGWRQRPRPKAKGRYRPPEHVMRLPLKPRRAR